MHRMVASSSSSWLQRVVGSGAIQKQTSPTTQFLRAASTRISIQNQDTTGSVNQNVNASTILANNNSSRSSMMALATMATTGMILLNTSTATYEIDDGSLVYHPSSSPGITHCEESSTSSSEQPTQSSKMATAMKFSKMGVNREDVDALVQVIMKDPSVNIAMLPDRLEAQLYKSTILLTLNAIYSLLGLLDGVHILSHELKLSIERDQDDDPTTSLQAQPHSSDFIQPFLDGTIKGVNDDVLRQVAKRLLMNPAVNSHYIPDALEEQIYTSCLQVVFRVIQIVFSTFKIEICGHDLTLQLASSPERLESAILAAAANHTPSNAHHRITPIDLDLLQTIAKRSGVDDETNRASLWNRLFTRPDFVQQLHVSLYGLILGILDDLFLGHLKVQILSDDIVFDLVPSSKKIRSKQQQVNDDTTTTAAVKKDEKERTTELSSSISSSSAAPSSSGSRNSLATSFIAGIGVGVTAMTLLSSKSPR